MTPKLDWRIKLDPLFFELAEANRRFERELERIQGEFEKRITELSVRPDQKELETAAIYYRESVEKLSSELDEKLVEINQRHPNPSYNPLAYSYLDLASSEFGNNLFPYLHWMRHRESIQATTAEDVQGNIKAWRKLARTAEDSRRIAYGKGQIKPFQGDVVHRQFLELILCYELNPLTAEERADCADAYCACGKIHDADALKKQYGRLKRELRDSVDLSTPATDKSPEEDDAHGES